jgi:hypothetical protein
MSNPLSKTMQLGFITASLILVLASSTHATEVLETQTPEGVTNKLKA